MNLADLFHIILAAHGPPDDKVQLIDFAWILFMCNGMTDLQPSSSGTLRMDVDCIDEVGT